MKSHLLCMYNLYTLSCVILIITLIFFSVLMGKQEFRDAELFADGHMASW